MKNQHQSGSRPKRLTHFQSALFSPFRIESVGESCTASAFSAPRNTVVLGQTHPILLGAKRMQAEAFLKEGAR